MNKYHFVFGEPQYMTSQLKQTWLYHKIIHFDITSPYDITFFVFFSQLFYAKAIYLWCHCNVHKVDIDFFFLTRDFWSKAFGSIEIPLPRLDSVKLYTDSGPRELFGVGMGVAAVCMMIGVGKVPRGSTCPFVEIIREYIFNSICGNERGYSMKVNTIHWIKVKRIIQDLLKVNGRGA